jgi:hypothetical protein
MAKFLVLYNSSDSASRIMSIATPQDVQASMNEWIKWKQAVEPRISVDFGLPLEALCSISAAGPGNTSTQASGYSIIEGEEDNVKQLLRSHPHLKRPGSSIDLLQMLSIPGLEA